MALPFIKPPVFGLSQALSSLYSPDHSELALSKAMEQRYCALSEEHDKAVEQRQSLSKSLEKSPMTRMLLPLIHQ